MCREHRAEPSWALHITNSLCPSGKRDKRSCSSRVPAPGALARLPFLDLGSPGRDTARWYMQEKMDVQDQREGETTEGEETALCKG